MIKAEQFIQPNIEHLKSLAKDLDDLQSKENDGRGVTCVQSIVAYLKIGKLEEAKRVCEWDHDKLRSYPSLIDFIKKNLYQSGEEHPWAVLERLRKRD